MGDGGRGCSILITRLRGQVVAASFRAPGAAVAPTRYAPRCAALRPAPPPRVASSAARARRSALPSALVRRSLCVASGAVVPRPPRSRSSRPFAQRRLPLLCRAYSHRVFTVLYHTPYFTHLAAIRLGSVGVVAAVLLCVVLRARRRACCSRRAMRLSRRAVHRIHLSHADTVHAALLCCSALFFPRTVLLLLMCSFAAAVATALPQVVTCHRARPSLFTFYLQALMQYRLQLV